MKHQVIVVLGMHRSGTSAVTRGLKALGVELGDRLVAPRADNPLGFWENGNILSLNILLLAALGLTWDSLPLIPPFRWQEPMVKDLQLKAVAIVKENIDSFHPWGFKDPRTLRVLPFWIAAFDQLQITPKYLLVVRNPLSVAHSLQQRNDITPEQSHLLWSIHNIRYLARIRNHIRGVVDYDLFMNNPLLQLRRIASKLGLTENRASEIDNYAGTFLSQDLRHSHYGKEDILADPHLNDMTKVAYDWLHRLARDEVTLASQEFWRTWFDLEKRLVSLDQNAAGGHRVHGARQPLYSELRSEGHLRPIHFRSCGNSLVSVRGGYGSLGIIKRLGAK